MQFKALIFKRAGSFRGGFNYIFSTFLPLFCICGAILYFSLEMEKSDPSVPLIDSLYKQQFEVVYNAILPSGKLTSDLEFIGKFSPLAFQMTPANVKDIAELNQAVFDNDAKTSLQPSVNIFSFYLEDINIIGKNYKYTAFINPRAQEGSAFAVNKINNAILRSATQNEQKEIITVVSSFSNTLLIKDGLFWIIGIFLLVNGAVSFSLFRTGFLFKEKNSDLLHQQLLFGVSKLTYLITNYLVDIFYCLLFATITCLLAVIFDAQSITQGYKLSTLWTIFVSCGFSTTSIVYLTPSLFRNPYAIFLISFFSGMIGPILWAFTDFIPPALAISVYWIFRLLVPFRLPSTLFVLSALEGLDASLNRQVDIFHFDFIVDDIWCWIGSGVIYLIAALILAHYQSRTPQSAFQTSADVVRDIPGTIRNEVMSEEEEVERSNPSAYAIKVDKIKYIDPKLDNNIDKMSFGVKRGECFALVKVHKAEPDNRLRIEESSICNILSGKCTQAEGKVYINGFSIPDQISKVRKNMGYCPADECLFENLTVKEHLDFYAQLRGISAPLREKIIQKQLNEFNLKKYENTPVDPYDERAEMKRKLSFAIATLTNPSILLLDEPSLGTDDETMIFLWNAISRMSRRTRNPPSILLATSSVQEAVTLATKVGVLKDGRFDQLGSPEHIRDKFKTVSYLINVELCLPSQQQIDGLMERVGCVPNEGIDKDRMQQLLDRLELPDSSTVGLYEFHSNPLIFYKFPIPVNYITEAALIYTAYVKVEKLLKEKFQAKVLTAYYPTFDFECSIDASLGRIVEIIEQKKEILNIAQYSIHRISFPIPNLF